MVVPSLVPSRLLTLSLILLIIVTTPLIVVLITTTTHSLVLILVNGPVTPEPFRSLVVKVLDLVEIPVVVATSTALSVTRMVIVLISAVVVVVVHVVHRTSPIYISPASVEVLGPRVDIMGTAILIVLVEVVKLVELLLMLLIVLPSSVLVVLSSEVV